MPPASTEAAKKTKAKADLSPDATGRAPRHAYWSEALTIKHEVFHMDDWETYAKPKMAEAETWIEGQTENVTVANLVPVTVLNGKRGAFNTKVDDKNAEAWTLYLPGAETRAYADGNADYQNLANSITP